MRFGVLAVYGVLTLSGNAQSLANQWHELLEASKVEEARELCTSLTSKPSDAEKAEGYKCLANVELAGQSIVNIQKNEAGGATMLDAYQPNAVGRALVHLNKALQLAPQDLSIHQGRLHLLEVSEQFTEMAVALDESCRIYKGKDEKHFPDNHEVIGNLGAVYSRLGNQTDAERYLRAAVALAPADTYDNWDLGHALERAGKIAEANTWYQKALSLPGWPPDQQKESRCLYAEFVEKKLKQKARACKLERASCPKEEQTACH